MKKSKLLLAALGLAATASFTAQAETQTPYTLDFDTPIATVSHNFRVASNWRHLVDQYDAYGAVYFVSYTYYATGGVDDSGYLRAGSQLVGDPYDVDDQRAVYDLLVTPVVTGDVSFAAKLTAYGGYIEVYALNEDGTRGTRLQRYSSSELSRDEWRTMTITLDTPQRVGIKLSEAGIDNFYAASAEIETEKSLTVNSAVPVREAADYTGDGATGTIYWYQQPSTQTADGIEPGKVLVQYTVTVTNDGEAPLTQGDENFSVSIINGSTKQVYGTVPVPQSLGIGDTSEPFVVEALVPASEWRSSYTYINMNVRENLMGGELNRAQSHYIAYEPVFVFREAGTTTTRSLASAINLGMITEDYVKELEIFNNGAAPLTIKSITAPEGFTYTVADEGEFVVAKKSAKALTLTLPATTPGNYSGDLAIVYLDKNGEEQTYTLPFSGTVLGANTWFATFDSPDSGSTATYPAGSVAEGGIQSDYQYNSSNKTYNVWLQSYTSSSYADSNNKFITPKLRANAGDVMTFDVARNGSSNQYFLKVYVSTDRQNWGEPVAQYTPSDITGSAFQSKSITFDQAGDYYVGFAIFGMKLDNVVGLAKVDVTHDVYLKSVRQDATEQSGKELTATLAIVPLTDEDPSNYTVEYLVDGEVKATVPSIGLTASANRETQFNAKWTPEVETTTTFSTYFKVTFTDGTASFQTLPLDITVQCQPEFVFFNKGTYSGPYNKPDSRKEAINFGKINETGLTQHFEIHNWGTAPLAVKNVNVPAGFSAVYPATEEGAEAVAAGAVTVPSKERQAVDIVLSATEAGTYEGNLEVVYVDASGADATFTLPVKAVMLDPSKWYASFDNGTSTGSWPAGSVHQSGVSLQNTGNYSAPNMGVYSTGTTDNIFITPKMSVSAGETLSFDSKAYDSSYYSAKLNVYASTTREGLANDEQRVLLGAYSKNSEDDATKLDVAYKTFTVTMPEAGEYYIGFELIERAYVDEIYGLTVAEVDHDLAYAAHLVPANATQNISKTATLSVRNFGLRAETADAYTLTAYVNGEAQTIDGYKEIPVADSYTATTTSFEIPFRSPKAGTFPVYLELRAGDQVIATEPQDVLFAAETLSGEIVVGTAKNSTDGTTPFNTGWKNTETVALYTQQDLGLSGGEKISQITVKGYCTQAGYVSDVAVFYQWVDATEEATPATGAFPTEGMTQVVDLKDYAWQEVGSQSAMVDMITIQFPEPAVYPAGKSLRLKFHAYADAYKSVAQFESSTWNKNCFQRQNDGSGKGDITSKSWTAKSLPVLHVSLVVTPVSLSGSVTDTEGNAAEGATVTLVSTDGENVQYEGTTAADGSYSIDVIQSSRVYDVLVSKDGKEDFAEAVEFTESQTGDFTLYEVANLNDETSGVTAIESALVKIDLGLNPGFNAVALPVALTSDEVAAMFGEDAKVYEFVSVDGEIDALAHFFAKTDGMDAGVPYLLEIAEAPAPIKVKGRAVVTDVPSVAHYAVNFTATYAPMEVNDGMFFLTADNYVATTAAATHGVSALAEEAPAATLPAFRAYVKARDGRELQTFRFDILTDYTGIEEVSADFDENAEIYNLQGIRVKNPVPGAVYIVNGKKVLVK